MRVLPCVLLAAVMLHALPLNAAPLVLPDARGVLSPVAPGVTRVDLPLPFATVLRALEQRYARDASVRLVLEQGADGLRTLTVHSVDGASGWARAVLTEHASGCSVKIMARLKLEGADVVGERTVPVQVVMPRSSEAGRMAREIDHLEQVRRR